MRWFKEKKINQIYKIAANTINLMSEILDPVDIEDHLYGTGNSVGIAFLNAMNKTLVRIEHPRYKNIFHMVIVGALYHGLTSPTWSPILIDFISELKFQLDGLEPERYRVDLASWPSRKGWAREKSAKK